MISHEEIFTYPDAPEQHHVEEVMRMFALAVNGSIVKVKGNILDFVTRMTAHLGEMNPSCLFWFELALEEALVNIPKHDMLNVHGTDIEVFNEGNWGTRHNEFVDKILAAQGLKSTIRVEVLERGIRFSYTLSRTFPSFPKKWGNARLESPDEEDLEKACGRGLLLMGKFFQDGHYDEEKLTLSFDRQWQNDDFIIPE